MSDKIRSKSQGAYRWLFQQAHGGRLGITAAVAFGFGSGLLLIIQARLIAHIVHGVSMQGTPRHAMGSLFCGLALVIVGRAICAWGREVAGFRAGAAVCQAVRMDLMKHITIMGPFPRHNLQTGALVSTCMEQVNALHAFFAHYLPQMALAVMIPLAILAVVFPLSWAAGGVLLVSAPLIPFFMILVGMGAESISQSQYQALARLSAHFLDVLQGLTTLKLLDRSRAEAEHIDRVSGVYRQRTMRVLRMAFLSAAVLEFFTSLSIALVAVYLGMRFLGYVDFGNYGQPLTLLSGFFILLLTPDFFQPLRELGTHYHARADALGAARGILAVLETPTPPQSGAHTGKPALTTVSIQCRDVHLAFAAGRRPALNGLNLEIAAGEQVALVGASGAGKTTLLNLLAGFLVPDRGRLLVNGCPLGTIGLDNWRQHLAWLGSVPDLFPGTLQDNILMGYPQATPEALARAVRLAGVAAFAADLPDGLQTVVGEQGVGLSQGQAQRVALARALIAEARFLLLDEPTASLDMESERFVMNGLAELTRGRTVLIITHRLAHIRQADRILVMEAGRIVESGDYMSLISNAGHFYNMMQHYRKGLGDG